jgi:hypothetical protein
LKTFKVVKMASSTLVCKGLTDKLLGGTPLHGRSASNLDHLSAFLSASPSLLRKGLVHRQFLRMPTGEEACQCRLVQKAASRPSHSDPPACDPEMQNCSSRKLSRRQVVKNVGAALAGLSLSASTPGVLWAEANHNVKLADVENTELRQALEAAGEVLPGDCLNNCNTVSSFKGAQSI